MRTVGRIIILLSLWLLAWGEASVANIASGVAAAVALLIAFPPGPSRVGRVRLSAAGIARLIAYVVKQLVVANAGMTRRILRNDLAHGGVLAHRLRTPSDLTVTLMSSIISLSPGTMTVDVDDRSETLYVHVLDLSDTDAARASLARLEQLVVDAVSTDAPVLGSETP